MGRSSIRACWPFHMQRSGVYRRRACSTRSLPGVGSSLTTRGACGTAVAASRRAIAELARGLSTLIALTIGPRKRCLKPGGRLRWKHQLRYLVVGNGLERLIDEYFPETASLSTASIHLIQRQSFPAEGNFNFRSWQESWQVLLILVLTVVVWSLVLMVALRRDWIARVQSGARHPSALSEGTAVTDGRRL